jgi:hypothetical protein
MANPPGGAPTQQKFGLIRIVFASGVRHRKSIGFGRSLREPHDGDARMSHRRHALHGRAAGRARAKTTAGAHTCPATDAQACAPGCGGDECRRALVETPPLPRVRGSESAAPREIRPERVAATDTRKRLVFV